jgi:hypothetical protein
MKWFVDEPWVLGASLHDGAVMVGLLIIFILSLNR